jgi:hypothetical protein
VGIEAGESVLVVVDLAKIELLRSRLRADVGQVTFIDMGEVGQNPARIIPAWSDFVREFAGGGRRVRGIGEAIGPDRGPDELVESQLHENLLNVVFDGEPAWQLLCPYDVSVLAPEVVHEARRSHPYVVEEGRSCRCGRYPGPRG